jgi:hypothetical protein
MSRSGVLGVRLGGVNEMKREIGFEEGPVWGSEVGVDCTLSVCACSPDVDDFARSFDTTFVMETFGGTSVTWLRDFCRNLGVEDRPSLSADFGGRWTRDAAAGGICCFKVRRCSGDWTISAGLQWVVVSSSSSSSEECSVENWTWCLLGLVGGVGRRNFVRDECMLLLDCFRSFFCNANKSDTIPVMEYTTSLAKTSLHPRPTCPVSD